MTAYVEDFEDDFDEDYDDAFGEDDFSERRKRRGRKPKGGGYAKPRIEKSFVTQTQLQAASARIGEDIRGLAGTVKAVETRVDRTSRENGQRLQMMALLPLMIKPKTVTLNAAVANMPTGTSVMVEDNDTMSKMLPLLLMGGMGSQSANGSNSGGMDMMMLMVMMIAMDRPKATT